MELSIRKLLDGISRLSALPIHINESTAILNQDKSLTINISHLPINLKNNLITEGRNNGAMLLRWIGATNHPIPKVLIKKLDSMEIS